MASEVVQIGPVTAVSRFALGMRACHFCRPGYESVRSTMTLKCGDNWVLSSTIASRSTAHRGQASTRFFDPVFPFHGTCLHSPLMNVLSLDKTVRIREDTVFRELEGEAILLQLEAGMYFGLDPVGTRLWQLMAERGKLRDVFNAARQEFDVDAETLQRDLLALVTHLAEKKLVSLD